jgi:hypothetical protein
VREPDSDSRSAEAAALEPQRVIDDLAVQAVTAILTSTDAVVLERTAPEVSILKALDAISLAPVLSLA